MTSVSSAPPYAYFTPNGRSERRQQLALKHLYSAARGGYSEAYYEIWRSQAALARYYKAKYDERLRS